jgi:ubiquinone/menaquinone biosynthesis C-methylase UbiE/uncharacterized protein YbaR (Trm112 family)
MIEEVLKVLRCAECSGHATEYDAFDKTADGRVSEGVLWCAACRSWYPISDGVLELLPAPLAYHQDRDAFWSNHAARLEAHGLERQRIARPAASPSQEAAQQRHFDWYASNAMQTYNAYERTPFWQAVDRLTFREWRKQIARGAWLLDVGCAQGRSCRHFEDCEIIVVGFDVSKSLVQQAHRRYSRNGQGARMTFFAGDASRFPVAENTFDYVLVYGVLHHLQEPARACAEISRVLKRGGTYFGLENNVSALRPVFDVLMRLWPMWHEEAGAKPLMSGRELTDWFAAAGIPIDTHSSTVVPPHLANRLSAASAMRLIAATDAVLRTLPFLRQQGGLLVATGTKPAA